MERFDIRMFTSPWGKYFKESIRGTWMPILGRWAASDGWKFSGSKLYTEGGGNINPAPLVLIVADRIRDIDLNVEMVYKTAKFKQFDEYTVGTRRIKMPVYEHDQEKTINFTIPKFTDIETIFRIAPNDNLIYEIVSVNVTSQYRTSEEFTIFALASFTARMIFGQSWHNLYENMIAIKRGIWSAPTPCGTCAGTGLLEGITCPECEGWRFSGSQAVGYLLDQKGNDVRLSRNLDEDDEDFRKRIWARKWWVIPTKEEIKRYFEHFCHAEPDDVLIYEVFDEQEPTFFVAVNPDQMGSGAIWQAGDQFENYDGLVEIVTPAGVNGYFAWLLTFFDEVDTSEEWTDDSLSQLWQFMLDVYGAYFGGSVFLENHWGESEDASTMCSGFYSSFENFYPSTPGAHPTGWGNTGTNPMEVLHSFLGHNKPCRGSIQSFGNTFIAGKGGLTMGDPFQVDVYMCLLKELSIDVGLAGVSVGYISALTDSIRITFYRTGGVTKLVVYNIVNSTGPFIYILDLASPAELNKWYHVHLEVDRAGGTADAYLDGNYIGQLGIIMAGTNPTTVRMVSNGVVCDVLFDAIDGSWDSGYWFQSNGSTCMTRNMLQQSHAPEFDDITYAGTVNPVTGTPSNHWAQGFTMLDVDAQEWLPYYEGHEAVVYNANFQVSVPDYPGMIQYWYYDSGWVHRRILIGEDLRQIYDDHVLVSSTPSPPLTYTINHTHVSGVVINDFDFINAHGGIENTSSRTSRVIPSEWSLRGKDIGLVDEWKGMLRPTCIYCNGIHPQFIVDTETIGNGDSSWEFYVWLDPDDDSKFKVQFVNGTTIAFQLVFYRGIIHDHAMTQLAHCGNKYWVHVRVEWALAGHTFDLYVDGTLQASGTSFQNNTNPFTHINIGWMEYSTNQKGSVAYISRVKAGETSFVDESTSEAPSGGILPLQSAISQKLETFDFNTYPNGQDLVYSEGYERENQALLSFIFRNKDNDDNEVVWIGDKIKPLVEKVQSHYKKATYNFRFDTLGDKPRGWEYDEPVDTTITVENAVFGHQKVVYLFDDNPAASCWVKQHFGLIESGYVELWVLAGETNRIHYIRMTEGGSQPIEIRMNSNGEWTYNGTNAFDGNPTYNANKWYHVRIYFDCATDTYNVWIDGTQLLVGGSGDIPFIVAATNLTTLYLITPTGSTGINYYIDAIAYSWDKFYTLGDNHLLEIDPLESDHNGRLIAPLPMPRWTPYNKTIVWTKQPLDKVNYNDISRIYKYNNDWENRFTGTFSVEQELAGHLNILYTDGSAIIESFTSVTAGSVELWLYTEGTAQISLRYTGTPGPSVVNFSPGDYLANGTALGTPLEDLNGNSVVLTNKGWHHLEIEFDCSTDLFRLKLNGEYVYNSGGTIDHAFINALTQINNISIDGIGSSDIWIDGVSYSWDTSYPFNGVMYPYERNGPRTLSIRGNSITINGNGLYFPINKMDNFMIISKGLNKLLTN